ncbi:MAG: flagellar type III secretion system pore protein FliP [Phycisphaerales bacterium]|nr:MAG: flagellar type III secretion system pore protein FliP [Phycisphaerales bacterium]
MQLEQGRSQVVCLAAFVVAGLALTVPARAQPPSFPIDNPLQIPDLSEVLPPATDREGISATLKIFVIMTVLALAPSIVVMTTCFTRIIVVLGFMRQAVGTSNLPPGQVIMGLSLFMTILIMAPTWGKINREAIQPYLNDEPGMTQARALELAGNTVRDFMYRQIERAGNEEDIYLFLEYQQQREIPLDEQVRLADVPATAMIPAFMLSELKIAFVMGFRVYLPFLVIDMVIASILISMGMLMLPPVMISLPFKVLMFVLADGWHLVVGNLLDSFTP